MVYFPVDGQVSEEFAKDNGLLWCHDENGNNTGGYLDPNKRNITAIKLRGEQSDGLVLPIEVLTKYTNTDLLVDGQRINILNGNEICKKYIPARNKKTNNNQHGNKTRKHKDPIAPTFAEHADTEQLAYNLGAFKDGDYIEVTLKMHGTSGRTAYLPVLKGYKKSILDRILRRNGTPTYEYDYVSGTRRTVLDDWDGGFYGSNEFRKQHHDKFIGKLWKGETVYYEIVGFTDDGKPIMASADNRKLKDKEFVKKYGKETVFSYGCDPDGVTGTDIPDGVKPKSDLYVYRMTMTNEDGDVVEYSPDFVRYRCEQMGVKTVPVLWKGVI